MAGKADKDSDLEVLFDYYLSIFGNDLPYPVSQHKVGQYVVDRAWPEFRLAVELNGGAGGGYGRPIKCHRCGTPVRARKADGSIGKELRLPYPSHSGRGSERDALKANLLASQDWKLYVFTSLLLNTRPEECINLLRIEMRKLQAASARPAVVDLPTMTSRELQVLAGIARGDSYNNIAFQLGITPRTVEKYAEGIRAKLGRPSTASAVAKAVQLGLVGGLE